MLYSVSYSASLVIEADTEEEARETFYQVYANDETREFAEVNYIEKIEENA